MNFIAAAALAVFSTLTMAQESEDSAIEEIVFVHYDWTYPAYYKPAPRRISRAMNSAATGFCSEFRDVPAPVKDEDEWRDSATEVCNSDDRRFFRGVTGRGRKSDLGYVCAGEIGLEKQKYFSEDMLREWSSCIQIYFDDDEDRYVVPYPGDA